MFKLKYLFHDICKIFAALPGLIAFRPKWIFENEEAKRKVKGGALLISNHMGFFDPVYLMYAIWYRRHHFIVLKEIFDGSGHFFLKNFLCIPIDRENFSIASFKEIENHLRAGDLVSMFPEGHINNGQGLGTFKSGMVLMAMRAHAPIVPVYITKHNKWYKRLVIVVGQAVDIDAICGDKPAFSQIEKITQLLQEKEQELMKMGE